MLCIVSGKRSAIRIARQSDLIALVPRSSLGSTDPLTEGLATFELPVRTPEIMISAMWHPRMDADPAHRWLRNTVMALCRKRAQPA
jgi:DNA-binding transcriptional LysR family regulator